MILLYWHWLLTRVPIFISTDDLKLVGILSKVLTDTIKTKKKRDKNNLNRVAIHDE